MTCCRGWRKLKVCEVLNECVLFNEPTMSKTHGGMAKPHQTL